ncbi:MAG: hypothetical protein COA30_00510 [Sulfurimonas sp.]|nr:MAG: hypothetical protein COA30_00510 [Sulfurimonas sp.]
MYETFLLISSIVGFILVYIGIPFALLVPLALLYKFFFENEKETEVSKKTYAKDYVNKYDKKLTELYKRNRAKE